MKTLLNVVEITICLNSFLLRILWRRTSGCSKKDNGHGVSLIFKQEVQDGNWKILNILSIYMKSTYII